MALGFFPLHYASFPNKFSQAETTFPDITTAQTPAWISNYVPRKMWDEITYPSLNFNGCTVGIYVWISNFIPYFIIYVISKRSHRNSHAADLQNTLLPILNHSKKAYIMYVDDLLRICTSIYYMFLHAIHALIKYLFSFSRDQLNVWAVAKPSLICT